MENPTKEQDATFPAAPLRIRNEFHMYPSVAWSFVVT